jgi:6-phosphogluconolactonase
MFMVTGEGKAEAIKNVLKGPRDVDSYPAQLITPTHGAVTWLLDRDAAKLL